MTAGADETDGLRAEHDRLAERLAARRSVDQVRRGAWAAFLLIITGGLAAKLAWDRWGSTHPRAFKGPPVYFYLALLAALSCLAVGAVALARARRLMRDEDRDFTRLRDLRRRLGLDS
ncbi:MAG TPA: hypothetical protein VFR85_13815 [Anaeromyxobacteraceae bacterium]|nr:hypothetical protein [Anaeromyxobacteraceae bacterium]